MSADQIPHGLGAGETVTLSRITCPVNVAIPHARGSALVHGAAVDSPIGPRVIVGVAATLPGEDPRCYLAHLTADEATVFAAELLLAAATLAEHERMRH